MIPSGRFALPPFRAAWPILKSKLGNRSRRCPIGILVSWNDFIEAVTKEILRGSKDKFLIVPITGKGIHVAVRDKTFSKVLAARWRDTIHL